MEVVRFVAPTSSNVEAGGDMVAAPLLIRHEFWGLGRFWGLVAWKVWGGICFLLFLHVRVRRLVVVVLGG